MNYNNRNNPRHHRDSLRPAHLPHRRATGTGRSHPARAGDHFRGKHIPPRLAPRCQITRAIVSSRSVRASIPPVLYQLSHQSGFDKTKAAVSDSSEVLREQAGYSRRRVDVVATPVRGIRLSLLVIPIRVTASGAS
jgi:hypothetical protein